MTVPFFGLFFVTANTLLCQKSSEPKLYWMLTCWQSKNLVQLKLLLLMVWYRCPYSELVVLCSYAFNTTTIGDNHCSIIPERQRSSAVLLLPYEELQFPTWIASWACLFYWSGLDFKGSGTMPKHTCNVNHSRIEIILGERNSCR